MRLRSVIASALGALLLSSAYAADAISLGSPAPPISVKTWLKGTPVTEFDPAKTYVVEFWATWCGPCIQSIPHVTKLAKANPDVTFMGIGIWEDDGPQLKTFVDKMGDKMGYNVGYSGNKEGMAVTWMDAAGQNGIPSAFVIKEGKVAWVGHPMELDQPLAEIKAGTFDAAAFKAKFDADAEKTRKATELNRAMAETDKQFKAGKREEAKSALAKLVAENPKLADTEKRMRFNWLAVEDPKAWEIQATKLAASKEENEPMMVASFALSSASVETGYPMARKAIAMVTKAKPDDFMVLQYARAVYKRTKDTELELAVTKRLLAILPNTPAKDSAEFKAALEKDQAALEAKVAKSGE